MKRKNEDIVIVSKEKKFWLDSREKTESLIEELEKSLKFNRAILEKVKEKLKECD